MQSPFGNGIFKNGSGIPLFITADAQRKNTELMTAIFLFYIDRFG
jgi:hypothetical protein